jgi:6-phosphogluconate dehydrogenase (decarboxylating)
MMRNAVKRAISFTVFGFGILGGLWGCVASAGGVFTIGGNDSYQEILAIIFACITPFPVCILALWKRFIAGLWLIFAGCYFTYGMMAERAYMIQEMHDLDQPTIQQTIQFSLPISLFLIGIGLFGVVTDLLKWPKLLGSRANTGAAVDEPEI